MATFIGDPRYRGRCDKCNVSVSEGTVEWSMNKYGCVLCFDCQPRKIEEVTKKWKSRQEGTLKN